MPPPTELSLKDTRAALSYAGELAASREVDGLVAQVRTLPRVLGADSIIIGQVTRAAPAACGCSSSAASTRTSSC